LLLLVLGLIWGLQAIGIDVTRLTPEGVRAYLLSFGALAPVLYLAVYGQPIVPLPASVMTMAGGLAFGPLWGLVAAVCGATIRASGQFLIARRLGRDLVVRLLRGSAERIDVRVGTHGFATVLLIRLIPNFPYDIQNFALGISRVRFWPYAGATLLGIMPASLAFVYLGDALIDSGQVWKLLAAVLLVICMVWLQRRVARRARIS
jgi:uncharacterized membrane protein YdjX (TVP38/TMEM64 family)